MAIPTDESGEAQVDVESDDDTDVAGDDDKELLKEALARFDLVAEAEAEERKLQLDDLKFTAGQQWPDDVKQERMRDSRPCLVVNKMKQFVLNVTNDQRQNRSSIKVHPIDDNGDIDTAKIIEGMIRHIRYNSNADVAEDTAFSATAKMGRGYFRIITDYADSMSFEQDILYKRIRNRFSVYFDPHSQELDGSDANFAFIAEDLSKDEYESLYPDSKLAESGEWESTGNALPTWFGDKTTRVVEYFYKVYENKKIALLSDGSTVPADKMPKQMPLGADGKPLTVVKERETRVPTVKWCKMNACEILERTDWPGKWIPIIPVYGDEDDIEGKLTLSGIVRNAKDPARIYNYWTSAETETIALAPRAPWVIAEGQVEDYKDQWESANRRNHAYLPYKPTSVNGTAVPPPQRQAFEPAIQAISQAKQGASEDMKATTGIYNASLGAPSNETSGVAIQKRNQQSQGATFHMVDNLSLSRKHAGRIMVDLIPYIYDTARAVRILGDDGEQKIVKVNEQFAGDDGKPKLYSMDAGKYDVAIDNGPSFATKRQEAVQGMIETMRAVPDLMKTAGDLFIKNMDWPGASDIAERLKKMLPPNLIDDPSKPKPPIPPQVQAQMQQMGHMVEQLTQQLHKAHDVIDQKTIELESKERIEFAKLQVDLELGMAKLGSKESIELMRQEIRELEQRMQLVKFNQPIQMEPPQPPPMAPGQGSPEQGPPMGDQGPAMGQGQPPMGPPPTGGASPGQPMEQPQGNP